MQVKPKVFTRDLILMLGVVLYKKTVIFIKWPKRNVRKHLLSDVGCLVVFNPILFSVHTCVCTCYMQMHSGIEQALFVNFDQFLYCFPWNILLFLPSASSFRNVFVALCK